MFTGTVFVGEIFIVLTWLKVENFHLIKASCCNVVHYSCKKNATVFKNSQFGNCFQILRVFISTKVEIYRITGNFGSGFNLAIWRLKSL